MRRVCEARAVGVCVQGLTPSETGTFEKGCAFQLVDNQVPFNPRVKLDVFNLAPPYRVHARRIDGHVAELAAT